MPHYVSNNNNNNTSSNNQICKVPYGRNFKGAGRHVGLNASESETVTMFNREFQVVGAVEQCSGKLGSRK